MCDAEVTSGLGTIMFSSAGYSSMMANDLWIVDPPLMERIQTRDDHLATGSESLDSVL
jgi:hypothetical protein